MFIGSGRLAGNYSLITFFQRVSKLCCLAHPLILFITEEIWQKLKPLAGVSGETILWAPYPQAQESKIDQAASADIEWLKAVILGVRNIRGEMNISPAKKLPVYFYNGSA